MWTFRLIICSGDDGETTLYGDEKSLLALRRELEERVARGSHEFVEHRAFGETIAIQPAGIQSFSDIDPVIAPKSLVMSSS